MSIGLETAKSITAGVRAAGRDHGLKPLTVVVLDAGGHVVSVEREDGSSNNRFEIAFGKAYGALALGMGSRSLMARAEQQAYFLGFSARIWWGKRCDGRCKCPWKRWLLRRFSPLRLECFSDITRRARLRCSIP